MTPGADRQAESAAAARDLAAPTSRPAPAALAGVQRLQQGPILSTLLRLAAPNVLAMVMQVLVSVAETIYIGRLGTTPLAAMALVFPFLMLAQQLSAGAMSGGVSSAVSRALGAGNLARARALAQHALLIGALLGGVFTLLMLLLGPAIYAALGGRGAVLQAAVDYSGVLFFGALFVWLGNTLASVLRGSGNMRVPALAILATALLQIVLGGVLALGLGDWLPSLGMAGVAWAYIVANLALSAVLAAWLLGGRSSLGRLPRRLALQHAMFNDILTVGAISMLSPLQSVLTVVIFTGFIARLGAVPLAGYAIGQRLEFLLVPISFGIGVASLPMVGMAIGAGRVPRARQVAWTAAGATAVNLGLIGALVALWPQLWATLFSHDASVLSHAQAYLRIAGPAFPFFGLGLTLYFSSQGAGRMLGPVLAGTLRLLLVAGGGWLMLSTATTNTTPSPAASLPSSAWFTLSAAAMLAYGLASVAAVRFTRWGPQTP
ncbi:MAG: Multidrug export protein MepA [Pseudomonadota bacterium]|jgi:putative MATE family efflux protein